MIRSLQYRADTGYLSFQVGSAITFDSEPEREYEECLLKAKALLEVLGTSISRAKACPAAVERINGRRSTTCGD